MGQQALGTLTLEVLIPPEYFQVQDMNGEQEGIQVQPGELAGAVVNQNEVNAESLLRYQVSGLEESDMPTRTVLTLSLIPMATGVAEVNLQTATATAPVGEALDMGILQPIKLIDIHEATVVATPVPTAVPVETAEPGAGGLAAGVYYRIQQGENLFRLALRFGSTAEEIAAVNGITEMYSVPAEMVLRIPVPPPQGQAAYMVSAGETLYEIAGAFDLTVEDLAAWNGICTPYHIQRGRWLVLQR
ncbi:MAG: LysM peptidoglycan-binding domain-containing protein [Chloroflexota bacterium]|nr:LysM peptidoglycan-binding domain-containing protein [Chloroflexota bacterium]